MPQSAFLRSHRLPRGASCAEPQHAAVKTVINSRVAPNRPSYRAPMAPPPGDKQTIYFSDDPDEDTIEMVLSPDDMRLLSHAAEEQQREARLAESTSAALHADQAGAPYAPIAEPAARTSAPPPAPQPSPAGESPPAAHLDSLPALPNDPAAPLSTSQPAVQAHAKPPTPAQSLTPPNPAATTPQPAPPASTAPSAITDSAAAATHNGATHAPQSTASQRAQARNLAILTKSALAGAIGALLIVLAISLWHTAPIPTKTATSLVPPAPQAHAQSPAPTSAPVATSAAAPATAATASPQPAEPPAPGRPLRLKNPFDKSEIFEFPSGTSVDEARQSVASLLLQRARDRRAQPGGLQHRPVNTGPRGSAAKNTDLARNGR